jgi:hypothetical protein
LTTTSGSFIYDLLWDGFARLEFLLGTAGLAIATVLPACSQTTKIVQNQTAAPEICSVDVI